MAGRQDEAGGPALARIIAVVGARPNFPKMAPVVRALRGMGHDVALADTGQHRSWEMSGSMLRALDMGDPEIIIDAPKRNRGSRLGHTVHMLSRHPLFEGDCAIVAGDVDSTLAGALAAKMCGIPLVHLESGLRSYNPEMPEELNRRLVDHMSDLRLCSCPEAMPNLEEEGLDGANVYVGNTMIDSLVAIRAATSDLDGPVLEARNLESGRYVLCTFHRPSLVDDSNRVHKLLAELERLASHAIILIAAHPRLVASAYFSNAPERSSIRIVQTQEYSTFLALMANAMFVITDSGGVQEETTYMGIPCLTFRSETERRCTAISGTNTVVGTDPRVLYSRALRMVLEPETAPRSCTIPRWDGESGLTAARAVSAFCEKILANADGKRLSE